VPQLVGKDMKSMTDGFTYCIVYVLQTPWNFYIVSALESVHVQPVTT